MFKYNVLSEKFRDASIDFCRTVVGFNKQTQLSRIATPDGAVAANNRDTRDARMALVLQTCQHLTSMREEIKDDEMAAWADTMRKLIFGIEGGVPIELSALSPDSTGTSMYEIMMFASQYRASNSEWYVHLQTMPDAKSVIKSIVAIRATMLYMRFQRYKLREYQTGLIATIQGAEANQYFDESVGNIQEARF